MRLPWEQIAMEVIEVSAPELAAKLDISEAEAGWGLVVLVKWALARCRDDQPPSANDVVIGSSAARQIARAAGFRGQPDVYVKAAASLSYPVLEVLPDGVRIRGLDRYDAAWGDRNEAAWKAWKAKHPEKYGSPTATRRRSSGGSPAEIRPSDPDADADADPKTPPLPPSARGAEPARTCRCTRRPCRHELLRVVPDTPTRTWDVTTPAGQAYEQLIARVRTRGAAQAASQLERLRPELAAGKLVVHADDAFFGEWIAEHYLPMLREEAAAGAGPPVELRYPPKPAGAFA